MSWIPWGTDAVLWVQGFRTPFLDQFFKAVTFLGQEEFYLLLLPLIYWAISKRLGIRLAFILLPSAALNGGLKELFRIPRPDPARVTRLVEETSYAFPSGHAQNTTVLFGFLAVSIRRRLFWALSAMLVIGVSLSRVYLGVHYPQDVVSGALIGALFLFLVLWLEKPVGAWLGRQSMGVQAALALLLPVLLLILRPVEYATPPLAALAGIGVAYVLDERWIRFETGGALKQRVLRCAVGLVLVLMAYLGLKFVLPEGAVFRFLRYLTVGLTVGFIAPWVFVKTGLAGSTKVLAEGEDR